MKQSWKKIKQYFSKHDMLLVVIIAGILSTMLSFNYKIGAEDSVWNFANIYKMANGYTIYQELNVIVTPLYFEIGKIFLLILGKNWFSYIIYNVFISMFFMVLLYKIWRKLGIRKLNSILYIFPVILITRYKFIVGISYNELAVCFLMWGILELLKENRNIKSDIFQGILLFILFLTKQNIAVFYAIGLLLYSVLCIKNKKEMLKSLSRTFMTSAVLLSIFIGYLYSTQNLYPFINYTILGMQEFTRYNGTKINWQLIVCIVEAMFMLLILVGSYHKKITFTNTQKRNIRLLSSFSIALLGFAYPMVNDAHTIFASVMVLVTMFYFFDLLIFQELLVGKKVEKVKEVIVIALILYFGMINMIQNVKYVKYIGKQTEEYKQSAYNGAVIGEKLEEEIKQMCLYLTENTDAKVVSYYANLYNIPLNRNNGILDLPFYGNMGKEGENGLIQQIQQMENVKILILTKEDNLFQESKKVTDWIRGNLKEKGSITRFTIYEKE